MTENQREELKCVAALQRETFIHQSNWRGLYQGLVQRGLVTWTPHQTMGPQFRSVELTDAGRSALLNV
jgi:DNA-binding IclR family transcriptional regulator